MGGILYFFFNDTATTEIYTLSLHDALPIFGSLPRTVGLPDPARGRSPPRVRSTANSRDLPNPLPATVGTDRKSTRLNSSHANISYAVFCLKKKIVSQVSSVTRTSTEVPTPL